MDKLSIFSKSLGGGEVTVKSDTTVIGFDDVIDELTNILRELQLTRKGQEEYSWGDTVEDSEIDLEGIEEELND